MKMAPVADGRTRRLCRPDFGPIERLTSCGAVAFDQSGAKTCYRDNTSWEPNHSCTRYWKYSQLDSDYLSLFTGNVTHDRSLVLHRFCTMVHPSLSLESSPGSAEPSWTDLATSLVGLPPGARGRDAVLSVLGGLCEAV